MIGGKPGKIETPFPIMCHTKRKRRVTLMLSVLTASRKGKNQMMYHGA